MMFFCKGMDKIIAEIKSKCATQGIVLHDILLYADDLTVVSDTAEQAARAAAIVEWVFKKYHLTIDFSNRKKTGSLVAAKDPYWSDPTVQEMFQQLGFHATPPSAEFVALGGDLGTCIDLTGTSDFWKKQERKQKDFFDLLASVNEAQHIHPAVLFTILRLCGNPRLEYICSVSPMCGGLRAVCKTFDEGIRRILDGPTLLRGRLAGNCSMIYEKEGAGMTNYIEIASQLYDESKRQAFASGKARQATSVVPVTHQSATNAEPSVQRFSSSAWMFYTSCSYELTPAEFVTSLCYRMLILPEKIPLHVKCDCHTTLTDPLSFMDHSLKCDKMTNFGFKARHDTVVNDALIPVARSYGINCTVEPGFYTYSDGARKRPDITFHTNPKIATDVTIVYPSSDGVSIAARQAAIEKERKHGDAVRAVGHEFVPFAMEVTGVMDNSAEELIRRLGRGLPPNLRQNFYSDMNHAVQVAVARGRANAINSAIAKQRAAEDGWRLR
jgi:hypothetical protein